MQSILMGNLYPGTSTHSMDSSEALKPRYVPAIPGPVRTEFQMTGALLFIDIYKQGKL